MASYPGSFPRTVVSMGSPTSDISYLPTSLVRDVFAVAVVVQHVCSPNAELGLQGTRSVVYSSVYHTTVVARLMGSWGERREEERREGGRRNMGGTSTTREGSVPKVTVQDAASFPGSHVESLECDHLGQG